jgi:hypothetical protein
MEEALTAFLVLPCPQNILLIKSTDRPPPNLLSVDSLLYVTRILGVLIFFSLFVCLSEVLFYAFTFYIS